MSRVGVLALVLLALSLGIIRAEEMVSVPGTQAEFPTAVQLQVNGKPVNMMLTGTALRRRFGFNIYALGSYVQQGVKIQSAAELPDVNCIKRLELVMQRSVGGRDMADAFVTGVRMNHAAPAFDEEIKKFTALIQTLSLEKGEKVALTNVPGVGLVCNVAGKANVTIKNPEFSRAIWEIYFGRINLGEAFRKSLVSRL